MLTKFIKHNGIVYVVQQDIINNLAIILSRENPQVIKDLVRQLMIGLMDNKP